MNERHEGTFEELISILEEALSGMREDDRRNALTLIRSELDPAEPSEKEAEYRKIERGLLSRNYYAIHNDDLKLLEQAVAVAAAMYAGIPDPISLVGGLAIFLYRYRRKRAALSMEQGVVLKTLTYAPTAGWTIEQLAQNQPLSCLKPPPDVAAVLASLKSVIRTDGNSTAFVAQEGDRWRVLDV